MRKILLAASLLASLAVAAQTRTLDDPAAITAWLAENQVPAAGIALIRGGTLREVRVYGDAAYDAEFNVASLAKPVVAVLTLRLVSAGKWSLDEPLATYWVDPDLAGDPRHRALTTRHVLSHRTGFPNWRWMDESKKLSFHFDPGTKFQYSGEGFEYLRKALEKKFGTSLPQLAQEHVFDPAGMRNTRWDPAHVNAADDLLTTAEDYGRFGAWVLGGAGLPDKLWKEMATPNGTMGLGWEVMTGFSGDETVLLHSGSDEGVRAVVILVTKSKRGLVVLTNGDNGVRLYSRLVTETLPIGGELMARAK